MNPNRKLIVLNPDKVRWSRDYGEAIVRWYDSPEGRASRSRSRSGEWGAELDPELQGQGKAGEYAVAQYYGLNPKTAVNLFAGRGGDDGIDVTITAAVAVDAKTTVAGKRFLIWSSAVNDLYWSKKFTALVSVSIDEYDWSQCWIEGWIDKKEFFERKLVADGVNCGLTPSGRPRLKTGTWFMEKRDLHPIQTMLAGFVGYDVEGHFIHNCHCGKEGGFGFNSFPAKGELGTYYCGEHRPK